MKKPHLISSQRFLFLLIVLIAYFIITSIGGEGVLQYIANATLVLLIIYSLYVIGHRKRFLIIALAILGVVEILSIVLMNTIAFASEIHLLQLVLALLFFSLMTYATLNYTLRDEKITTITLYGAVCAYLFIGLAWSYGYLLLNFFNADAFNFGEMANREEGQHFIYYSFVTLTTLGYGDIIPVSNFAKVLSWMEAVTGQAYLTILIAQLVARYVVDYSSRR